MSKHTSDQKHLEVSWQVFDKFQHLKHVISQLTGNEDITDEQLLHSMIDGFFESIDGATNAHGHHHHEHGEDGDCCGGHGHAHGHDKKDKECCGSGKCENGGCKCC